MNYSKIKLTAYKGLYWTLDQMSNVSFLNRLIIRYKLYIGATLVSSTFTLNSCEIFHLQKNTHELKDQLTDSSANQSQYYYKPEPEFMCYVSVEEPPMFPGGDDSLQKYISQNVSYPDTAYNQGIEGRVYVRFCVNSLGSVESVSILRSAHYLLDSAAISVIKSLPQWTPGKSGGVPSATWYTVPINFHIDKSK